MNLPRDAVTVLMVIILCYAISYILQPSTCMYTFLHNICFHLLRCSAYIHMQWCGLCRYICLYRSDPHAIAY